MEHEFWHQRWASNEIGFHLPEVNPLLVKNASHLDLHKGDRVLLPLCGKTLDIAWLLQQGHRVVGVELSRHAIEQLFAGLGVEPHVTRTSSAELFSADGLDVFVGDFFTLTRAELGEVDAVYDRAALVAMPSHMREAYVAHLRALAPGVPQLLISFDYDQSRLPGPPFSVRATDVHQYYADAYRVTLLVDESITGGLKGKCPAQEQVWLLSPRA